MGTMDYGRMKEIIAKHNISSESIQKSCFKIQKENEELKERMKEASGKVKRNLQASINQNCEFMRIIIKVDNTR